MERYEPIWIFNFILKIATAIFLGTLALGLAVGVAPLTALMRSGAGFGVFALLAWGAAVTWELPQKKEEPQEEAAETAESSTESDATAQTKQQTDVPKNGANKSQNGTAQPSFTPLGSESVENISTTDSSPQSEPVAAGVIKEPAEAMP